MDWIDGLNTLMIVINDLPDQRRNGIGMRWIGLPSRKSGSNLPLKR